MSRNVSSDPSLPVLSENEVHDYFQSGQLGSTSLNSKLASCKEQVSLCSKLRAKMNSSRTKRGKAGNTETSISPSVMTDSTSTDNQPNVRERERDGHNLACKNPLNVSRSGKNYQRKRSNRTDIDDRKKKKLREDCASRLRSKPPIPEAEDLHGDETENSGDELYDEERVSYERSEQACKTAGVDTVLDQPISSEHQPISAEHQGQVTNNQRTGSQVDSSEAQQGHGGSCERSPVGNSEAIQADSTNTSPIRERITPPEHNHAGDAPPEADSESLPQEGVVRLGKKTAGGLPMYINSVGVSFAIDLTDEAKEYIHDLVEESKTGKAATVSKLKYLTVQALEQIIKYNDRPLYNIGGHPQLAAVVADFIKNGVPPRCPLCRRGALRFSNGKKKNGKKYYWCPGYSPNGFHFYGCSFKAQREDITRLPFVYPE